MHLTRRELLAGVGVVTASFALPSLAASVGDARFVLVVLRGALDGLAAVPPYGDGRYAGQRGQLAIESGLKLDGLFALHPALSGLHARYAARELVVLHAVASPYRERSHFDGQDWLESGRTDGSNARDGWLNRALPAFARSDAAIALAPNVPLVLRGEHAVSSWAPSRLPAVDEDTLARLADLYAYDARFAQRLQAAVAADDLAGESGTGRKRDPLNQIGAVAAAAGKFLSRPDGPRIAVIEASGWDTHANQGADQGQLALRLGALDRGLDRLRTSLGPAWEHTVVLVVTEFGRTVAINGTRGTDHGTGTCAFLVGGAVDGGRVVADWPGLAANDLYEGRDLRPTLDLRSLFKSVLIGHLGARVAAVEATVFPDSRSARPLDGLLRT
jgi:uncharacterized protein (DUF1501 family)